jgi:hypothetical protein
VLQTRSFSQEKSMQHAIWFTLVVGGASSGYNVTGRTGAPCPFQHAKNARWMTSNIKWGVMSTISTQSGIEGTAFGNPVSFGDAATGIPYMSPRKGGVRLYVQDL